MADLSFTDVGEIVGLIDRLDCDAFNLEYGELRISVRRGAAPVQEPPAQEPPTPEPSAPPPSPAPMRPLDAGGRVAGAAEQSPTPAPSSTPPPTAEQRPEQTPPDWVAVRAPMIGTFYRRRSPDEPPLVEVGDPVQPGQVVGLIEVMKLFSDLKAEQAGTVARIDAADAALVEFGQPLVWVRPANSAPGDDG